MMTAKEAKELWEKCRKTEDDNANFAFNRYWEDFEKNLETKIKKACAQNIWSIELPNIAIIFHIQRGSNDSERRTYNLLYDKIKDRLTGSPYFYKIEDENIII